MKRVYGDMVLVTRFKLLMARRRFVDSVRNTVEGKIALVMMAASPFLMKSLLVSSTMRAAEANRETEAGILAVAHVFMAVALVLGVSSRTARSVIVGWRSEPLVLCAGATRGLAAYHLWGEVVVATALWLLVFFYVFYGGLVVELGSHPLLSLTLHGGAHILVTLPVGVLAYRLTLRLLERKPTAARSVFNIASTGSLIAFLAMAGAPRILQALSPTVISVLATPFALIAMVYPPTALFAQGGLSGLAFWAGGSIALPILALRLADSPIHHPSAVLFREVEPTANPRFLSLFRPRGPAQTGRLGGALLFFLKDVVLPARRNPRGFFRRGWIFLAVAVGSPVAVWRLRQEATVSEAVANATLLGLVMALPSAAAYLHGLGSLGREGPHLALLRPTLSASLLFSHKAMATTLVAICSGVFYGTIYGATSAILGLWPGPLLAVGVGAVTAAVAGPAATAVGFLLPDFRNRNVLVPGSSATGRIFFASLTLYGIGVTVAIDTLTRTGVMPPQFFAIGAITTATAGLGIAGVVTFLALRQFPRLET